MTRTRILLAIVAAAAMLLSVWQLESARSGLSIRQLEVDGTPATLFTKPGADGPLVMIAHGFAGSRQLMHGYAISLAREGYSAILFDFEGHGRNPQAMRGDVTDVRGTTRYLVAEILDVASAGREAAGFRGDVALLGHSMASDLVIRAARELDEPGPVVAVSMFSNIVSSDFPESLLIISGQWETGLRSVALDALRKVDQQAEEGETAISGEVRRRAVVAPWVGHVGVLFSQTALQETVAWLNAYYGRSPGNGRNAGVAGARGGWILLFAVSILGFGWGLAPLLGRIGAQASVPLRGFLVAALLPTLLVPLAATRIELGFLPVLVADYLALHLLAFGLIQLAVLHYVGVRLPRPGIAGFAALFLIGGVGFGLFLDRHVANFLPTGERWFVFAAMLPGALAFTLGDTLLTEAGAAALWRRILARVAFLLSLVLAAVIDLDRLMFLLIILPVILLFFLVYGLLGRWVALRSGATGAALALGLILAWALAATFPLFEIQPAGS